MTLNTVGQKEVFTARHKNEMLYFVCEPLERAGFVNAFSTRWGGVSPLPEKALNLSYREDKKENVDENRRRFLTALQGESRVLMTGNQTHSDQCLIINEDFLTITHEPACDAMVSSLPNILLGIQTADCLPILIGDPNSGQMAAIHSGWRGALARITEKTTLDFLVKRGAKPGRCVVALGPSACPECYEVGADLVRAYGELLPGSRKFFSHMKSNGKANLDVRAANIEQLVHAGIPENQIFVSPHCTIHQNDLFFSYRVEGKGGAVVVGRQLSVIGKK